MDPLPAHRERPHIRPFLPIGVQNEEKKVFVALRDPANLRGDGNAPVVPPEVLPLIGLLQGEASLEEITEKTGAPREFLVQLVSALDDAGLLWGPNAERLEREALDRIRSAQAFPMGAALAAGENPEEATASIRRLLDAAEDPELDGELLGIVAPHLDYARGGPTYATAYKACVKEPRVDRIVVLGTNHFGVGDGIVMSTHGFSSPWGAFPADHQVVGGLGRELGDRLFKDEIDHLAEHSISIHLPWVHTVFGRVPIVAALVPSPLRPMIADDGARVSYDEFLPALTAAIKAAPGRTLVIASADLSHVGPQFGDQTPVGAEIRKQVERYDRALLATYLEGNMDSFLTKIGADQNAQRWCSVGNMTAAKLVTGALPELVQYTQSPADADPNGQALVTCAAMGLVRLD
ncbi:MAG: AmmeMemoRadiSam system protein B [Phycisphaerales bacterium]|nr:AmmeMemoRadiSam system protein B [Phycisphaerales bacterium]